MVGGFNPSEKYYGLLRIIVEAQGSRTTLSPCAWSMSEKYESQLGLLRHRKWPIEIVDLPINSMVDLSSSFCKRKNRGENLMKSAWNLRKKVQPNYVPMIYIYRYRERERMR